MRSDIHREPYRELSSTVASDQLQDEMLDKLKPSDPVSEAIVNDELLLELGNRSINTYVKNKPHRCTYTSNKLRLCARIVLECRQISATSGSMSDFLEPQQFKCVVKAVQNVAGGTWARYDTPSNALKSGHHIRELCAIKEAS
jgi:hypothetical protein